MTDFTDLSSVVIDGYAESSAQGRMLGTFTDMPSAGAKHLGCIVLYTGTTGTYTHGRFYQCVSTGSAYEWSAVTISGTEEETYSANRALVTDSSGEVAASSVTSTEVGYLDGVTSSIQNQLDGKVPTTRKINGKALGEDLSLTAADVGALPSGTHIPDDVTVDSTLSSTSTNPVQNKVINTALAGKQNTITGAASTIDTEDLTGNRVLISNGSGKVAVSAVTSTELGYLDGVTSAIQTQINGVNSTLGGKVDKVSGKGLSANDFTDAMESKLSGIEAGAEVNVIEQIKVNSTAQSVSGKSVNITVPTKVSDLTNDSGYITKAVSDLTNYYTTSSTYSKSEVNNLVSAIPKFSVQVVSTLPTSNISTTTIYLAPKTAATNDIYDEYIYVNSKWEKIGSTAVTFTLSQVADGITINGTKLQDATASQDGIMTREMVGTVSTTATRMDTCEGDISSLKSRVSVLEEEGTASKAVLNIAVTSATGNINGLTVKAVPNSGNTVTGTTNASGTCALEVKASYKYTVTLTPPTNYLAPSSQSVTPMAGSGSDVAFTLQRKPLVNITVTDASSGGNQNNRAVQASGAGGTQTVNTNSGGTASMYLNGTGSYTFRITNIPSGGSASDVTQSVAADQTYSVSFTISFGWTHGLSLNSTTLKTDPTGCLTYSNSAAGFSAVRNTSSSLAKAAQEGNWAFDPSTGEDCEGNFYATFNSSGVLHQKLNPYDLTKYIAVWNDSQKKWDYGQTGNSAITTENTMFVMPTFYRKGSSGKLVHSSKSSEGTAYAHTLGGKTYKCLAIGAYLGYNNSNKLMSLSGKTASYVSAENFRTYARANTVRNGYAMVWNFHQWEAWKEKCYMRAKSFDLQTRVGKGGLSYNTPTTGLCNKLGPFAGNVSGTSDASKCLIENGWGCMYQFVDDAYYVSGGVAVGQNVNPTSNASNKTTVTYTAGWPLQIKQTDVGWSMPSASGGSSTTGTCDYVYSLSSSALPFLGVGGSSGRASNGHAGPGYVNSWNGGSASDCGARLAFLFDP